MYDTLVLSKSGGSGSLADQSNVDEKDDDKDDNKDDDRDDDDDPLMMRKIVPNELR